MNKKYEINLKTIIYILVPMLVILAVVSIATAQYMLLVVALALSVIPILFWTGALKDEEPTATDDPTDSGDPTETDDKG
ncbi:MAG: hypothetical protein JKY60_06825 [Kordiimonadaceae bacterium]|nr:hypothetical protein [Kordiimonadaceae bacterium]